MSPFWYEIIVYLCEAIISGIFFVNLLKTKYKVLPTLLLWCQIVVLLMFVTPAFSVVRILVTALLEFAYIWIMFEDEPKSKIIKYLFKQGLVILSSTLSFCTYSLLINNDASLMGSCTSDNCTYCLLYLLTLSVSTSIVYHYIRKMKCVERPWIAWTQVVIGIGECAAVLAVASNTSGVIDSQDSWLIILSAIFMMAANISIGTLAPYLLNQIFQSRNMDYGREISDMEYKYYEMSVENEKKLRSIRHDISNQIQTVYSLLQNGDNQKGLEIINQLKDQYSHIDQMVYCENPVVNIILSNKRSEADEKGIETHIKIKETLKDIPISDYDLSTVICNLLDNAIAGCIESDQSNPRLIVEILCKNQYLVVRVLNSCKVAMNIEATDAIESTKSKSLSHGIGMSIISGIAKKYRGDFVASARNGIFTATVVMSIK